MAFSISLMIILNIQSIFFFFSLTQFAHHRNKNTLQNPPIFMHRHRFNIPPCHVWWLWHIRRMERYYFRLLNHSKYPLLFKIEFFATEKNVDLKDRLKCHTVDRHKKKVSRPQHSSRSRQKKSTFCFLHLSFITSNDNNLKRP